MLKKWANSCKMWPTLRGKTGKLVQMQETRENTGKCRFFPPKVYAVENVGNLHVFCKCKFEYSSFYFYFFLEFFLGVLCCNWFIWPTYLTWGVFCSLVEYEKYKWMFLHGRSVAGSNPISMLSQIFWDQYRVHMLSSIIPRSPDIKWLGFRRQAQGSLEGFRK